MKWIIAHLVTQEFHSCGGVLMSKKRVCNKNAQSRFMHDSPKLEIIQTSVNRMDEQTVVYSYHRIALRNKKGRSAEGATAWLYAKWKEPDTKH